MRSTKELTILIAGCILTGCVTSTSYTGLEPVAPKPNSTRYYAPVQVNSLRPTFKWKPASPTQEVDIALWELWTASGCQMKGKRVYYKKAIVGGEHTLDADLLPDKDYCWSI
jgi:hypothetical protein